MLAGLAERFEVAGEVWALKDEFHVTAAHTPSLAERAGVSLDRAWAELASALEGRVAGEVSIGDELRHAREGDERTIVVMAAVDGLADLYTELSACLGTTLSPPPTHVTLYTRPDGKGIGIHDEDDLRELTEPFGAQEAEEIRRASGLDALV